MYSKNLRVTLLKGMSCKTLVTNVKTIARLADGTPARAI